MRLVKRWNGQERIHKKSVVFARLNLDQNSELNYFGNGVETMVKTVKLEKTAQETVQKTV